MDFRKIHFNEELMEGTINKPKCSTTHTKIEKKWGNRGSREISVAQNTQILEGIALKKKNIHQARGSEGRKLDPGHKKEITKIYCQNKTDIPTQMQRAPKQDNLGSNFHNLGCVAIKKRLCSGSKITSKIPNVEEVQKYIRITPLMRNLGSHHKIKKQESISRYIRPNRASQRILRTGIRFKPVGDQILSDSDECNIESQDFEDHIKTIPVTISPFKLSHSKSSKPFHSQIFYFLMKRHKVLFVEVCRYCQASEILILAKIKDFKKYKKTLKKLLKNILYIGLSTEQRINYWTTFGQLKERKRKYKNEYSSLLKKKSTSEMAITLDITRTFPSLDFFKFKSRGYNQLLNILKAISIVFPKIGYCQGMNFFSAIILLILGEEEEAFWMVYVLIKKYSFGECLSKNLSRLKLLCYQVDSLVQVYLPEFHALLLQYELTPEFYATQWIITLFSYDLPIEIVTKVIDIFLIDGWKFVFRLILSLLGSIQNNVKNLQYEELLTYIKSFTREEVLDEEDLLEKARTFKITKKMLGALEHFYYNGKVSRVCLELNPMNHKLEFRPAPGLQLKGWEREQLLSFYTKKIIIANLGSSPQENKKREARSISLMEEIKSPVSYKPRALNKKYQ